MYITYITLCVGPRFVHDSEKYLLEGKCREIECVCVQAGPNRSGIITGFRIVLNESGVGRGKRHPDTINGEIKFKTLLKPCNMLAAECGGM